MRFVWLFTTPFYEVTTPAYANGAVFIRIPYVTALTDGGNSGSGGLTFLYEVQCEAVNQSFCVHVGEMAHFPLAAMGALDSRLRKGRWMAGAKIF